MDCDEGTAVALLLAFLRIDLDGAAAIIGTTDSRPLLAAMGSFINGEGIKTHGLVRDAFDEPVKDADGLNVIDLARGRAGWQQALEEFLAARPA